MNHKIIKKNDCDIANQFNIFVLNVGKIQTEKCLLQSDDPCSFMKNANQSYLFLSATNENEVSTIISNLKKLVCGI